MKLLVVNDKGIEVFMEVKYSSFLKCWILGYLGWATILLSGILLLGLISIALGW
jgi:hypothetical protein